MTSPRWLVALLICGSGAAHAAATGDDLAGAWNFQVALDGKPIGQHRFTVVAEGDELNVRSVANFEVRIFGISAYRYRHQATEAWRGGCLASLTAHTDDDGKPGDVKLARDGDQHALTGPAGGRRLAGCVMSFAYWNPAIARRGELLNPQTGVYEKVRVATAAKDTLTVRGKPVEARRLRIEAAGSVIDVWYSPAGDWIGLDSVVDGRRLTYRLP